MDYECVEVMLRKEERERNIPGIVKTARLGGVHRDTYRDYIMSKCVQE